MKIKSLRVIQQTLWLFGTCSLLAAPIQAAVYMCNKNGEVVYTSSNGPGCKNANLQSLGSYSTSDGSSSKKPSNTNKKPAPAPSRSNNAPSSSAMNNQVNSNTQQNRDNGRYAILESELNNEKQALSQAQKALADGRAVRLGNEKNYAKYQERVRALEQNVQERQQNVQAIQKELNRM